ncbi:MAG: hypothetical protein ABFD97_01410 [Syntrophobacter sp.]
MHDKPVLREGWTKTSDEDAELEVRRAGARLRHFRGVAVSVMDDALRLWKEIWEALQDPRSCEEILDAGEAGFERVPEANRTFVLEKLHLLGIQIDYARRLCKGEIGSGPQEEGDRKNG